ncbi:MAG: hypothetical protein K2H16_02555, partial [Prevotella sp.]|nr:hypothetical protein [Prevotella sp.]
HRPSEREQRQHTAYCRPAAFYNTSAGTVRRWILSGLAADVSSASDIITDTCDAHEWLPAFATRDFHYLNPMLNISKYYRK